MELSDVRIGVYYDLSGDRSMDIVYVESPLECDPYAVGELDGVWYNELGEDEENLAFILQDREGLRNRKKIRPK